jgi:hypothetical protein
MLAMPGSCWRTETGQRRLRMSPKYPTAMSVPGPRLARRDDSIRSAISTRSSYHLHTVYTVLGSISGRRPLR